MGGCASRVPCFTFGGSDDDYRSGARGRRARQIPRQLHAAPVRLVADAPGRDGALDRPDRDRMHRQQRRALSQCRAHHAGDACRPRHPARPRAAQPHAGRRLCACHHRLPDPRHRLCPRAVQAGRQGRLCRRPHRPQGHAAARRLGCLAPALSCRPLEDVRDGAHRRHRPARQAPHRPRGRGHALSPELRASRRKSTRKPPCCAPPT